MWKLTESCAAHILSLTSPPDACRLAVVSHTFMRAAESDTVWVHFLPADYESIISRSSDPSRSLLLPPRLRKKDIFLSLSDSPILIDDGNMSFGLDKWTGKKCYMLSAKFLMIAWGDTPRYWQWTPEPNSRFGKVAELVSVCWLDIRGKINISMLSPATLYKAFFVYKLTERANGFGNRWVESVLGLVGSESCKRKIYFNDGNVTGSARQSSDNCPKKREDGWLEIELGEFLNKEDDYGELEMGVLEVKRLNWKRGLIVQGIEIRPSKGK